MKNKVVIVNLIDFWDTDKTVVKHLIHNFDISYFLIFNPIKSNGMESDVLAYCNTYNINLHLCPREYRLRDFRNFTYYIKIAYEINKISPKLVYHCSNEILFNLAAKLFIRCKNVILGIHDVQIHSLEKNVSYYLRKISRDLSFALNTKNCVFSKNQADLYEKITGRTVVNLGMSCKNFGVPNKKYPDIRKGVHLLFFGSIQHYKGLDDLISALEFLYDKGIFNIQLTIAGKGPHWIECSKYIRHQQQYNLQIRYIDDKEVPNLMGTAHFLVLPYRNATQSGPLLAALNYSLPIIAPNYGCFSDTYTIMTSYLYEDGHLRDCLEKVSMISHVQYENMRVKCNELKELYSEERIADNYIKFFNEIINQK